MSYSFRIRFKLPDNMTIGIDSEKFLLTAENTKPEVFLRSNKEGVPIKDAHELCLRGKGYGSENDAWQAGQRLRDAISLAFARVRIGADFGDRAPKGGVTRAGLAMFKQQTGRRTLKDVHGLIVFETEPPPLFAAMNADLVITRGREKLEKSLHLAIKQNIELSEQQRLSFDLFSSSFFQKSADTRFLLLMMAIETLLEPAFRPGVARQHIDELIQLTSDSPKLTNSEKDSFIGSLQGLYKESIGQAGRKLASKLTGHKYMERDPQDFFTYCYSLRSKLVHGCVPQPTLGEVGTAAVNLEAFAGDILCGPLLEMVPL